MPKRQNLDGLHAGRRVLVVGAGPAGCAAALAHAAAGAEVVLCEGAPKASQRRLAGEWLHPSGAEVLRELGVDLSGSHSGGGFLVHPEDGSEPVRLPYAGESIGLSWHHADLVERMRDHAAAHSRVDYRPGTRMLGMDAEKVALSGPDKRTEQHRFDRVVGADGKRSATARALGLSIESTRVSRSCGLTLYNATLPGEGFGHVALGGPGPMMIYRVAPDVVRVCVDVPDNLGLPTGAKHKERLRASLRQAYLPAVPACLRDSFAHALAHGSLQWVANNVRVRPQAKEYGRTLGETQVALVGDALGHYHPLTALGMSNGIMDAVAFARAHSWQDYARTRARESAMSGVLSVALYDMLSTPSADARHMRAALVKVWRKHPNERARTMRLLAGQQASMLSFGRSFLRVAGRGLLPSSEPERDDGRRRAAGQGLRYLKPRAAWLAKSGLRARAAAPRMHSGQLSVKDTAAQVAPTPIGTRELPKRPSAALILSSAREHLFTQQQADGAWEGEVSWCALLSAQYVLTQVAVGRLEHSDRAAFLRQFEATQDEQGCWGLHEVSAPYLFVTSLVYAAARHLGVAADDPLLARAGRFIREEGGVAKVPTWGKLWLAIAGVYSWEGVHPVVPELWLSPKALPLHPSRWYCHTRIIYLAMASLYARRFQAPINETVLELRKELFVGPWDQVKWSQLRSQLRDEEIYETPTKRTRALQRMSGWMDAASPGPLRRRALARLQAHILHELEASDGAGISPVSGMLNIIALHAASTQDASLRPPDQPDPLADAMQKGLRGIQKWVWNDDELGFRVAGARSATWDTAFALQALEFQQASEASEASEKQEHARAFLRSQQINQELPDGARFDRHRVRGGFCFGHAWHSWPVSDCTAEALIALLPGNIDDSSLQAGCEFILSCQNPDGGFGSFESKGTRVSLDWLNPAELFGESTTEASYPECTGSCLQALAKALPSLIGPDTKGLRSKIRASIRAGARFLQSSQREDGSWEGNWGVGYVYGTWFGLRGLRAAGVPAHDPAITRARDFLRAMQHPDGGWGEGPKSCFGGAPQVHAESQIVHTAWALLALVESGLPEFEAMQRGADFLQASAQFSAEGTCTWPKQDPAGVFFRTALLDYKLYRSYFPAWALGAHAQLLQSLEPAALREAKSTHAA